MICDITCSYIVNIALNVQSRQKKEAMHTDRILVTIPGEPDPRWVDAA